MVLFEDTEWIEVRPSNLKYYSDIDLYYRSPSGEILLYKQAGLVYDGEYQEKHPYKGKIYITAEDKIKSLKILQKAFDNHLTSNVQKKKINEVKKELINIVGETLSQPRSGSLKVVPEVVNTIVESFSGNPDVIKNLSIMSHIDYSTTIHSINVMALAINYCYYTNKSIELTRNYGLAALLHDVGKSEVSEDILTANRKLTELEFKEMQAHTTKGVEILKTYGADLLIAIPGAIEHHEKLNGSGYPYGITDISECGQILGIIDCYEAVTNDERPYRNAMQPIEALNLLKKEVEKGHYNKEIFKDFAYSLVSKNIDF
ncbi:MAG: HD domain-containing protein [Leptospiraceae bacterium]|nr:HD domain-containing protein [Leptospiraceae bacterium]